MTTSSPLTRRPPSRPATANTPPPRYTRFLDADRLRGARIGAARNLAGFSPEADAVFDDALAAMADAGATVVDPVEVEGAAELGGPEFEVLLYEFKADIRRYLRGRSAGSPRTLADLIAFNEAHAERELRYFGQEIFLLAQDKGPLSDPAYIEALRTARRLATTGIDKALRGRDLDALVAPTGSPAWPTDLISGDHFLGGSSSPSAVSGYPLISVPAGFTFGLPVGVSFMGTLFSEPKLLRLASGFEAATRVRRPPEYVWTFQG